MFIATLPISGRCQPYCGTWRQSADHYGHLPYTLDNELPLFIIAGVMMADAIVAAMMSTCDSQVVNRYLWYLPRSYLPVFL